MAEYRACTFCCWVSVAPWATRPIRYASVLIVASSTRIPSALSGSASPTSPLRIFASASSNLMLRKLAMSAASSTTPVDISNAASFAMPIDDVIVNSTAACSLTSNLLRPSVSLRRLPHTSASSAISLKLTAIRFSASTASIPSFASAPPIPAIGSVIPRSMEPPMRCRLPPTRRIFLPKTSTCLAAFLRPLVNVSRSLSVANRLPMLTEAAISRPCPLV